MIYMYIKNFIHSKHFAGNLLSASYTGVPSVVYNVVLKHWVIVYKNGCQTMQTNGIDLWISLLMELNSLRGFNVSFDNIFVSLSVL